MREMWGWFKRKILPEPPRFWRVHVSEDIIRDYKDEIIGSFRIRHYGRDIIFVDPELKEEQSRTQFNHMWKTLAERDFGINGPFTVISAFNFVTDDMGVAAQFRLAGFEVKEVTHAGVERD